VDDPTEEFDPVGQGVHIDDPLENANVLVGQFKQEDALVVLVKSPGAQL